MDLALTYDDVALVPQYRNISSRAEPTLQTWLTKDLEIGIPFIPANMDSVVGVEMAEAMHERGGTAIHHRFRDPDETIELLKDIPYERRLISWGSTKTDELFSIIDTEPVYLVCIDVAHGHDTQVMKLVAELKNHPTNPQVVAGNVCTAIGYQDLVNAGADAVKVGIGPGAACTTRIVTGFGLPQFTAVRDCAEVAKKLKVPIIADGGIRGSRDCVLALAAGATSVMIGKLFAATVESAAKKVWSCLESGPCSCTENVHENDGFMFAQYRGQASRQFQEDYYGTVREGTVPEGEDMWIPVTGTVKELVDKLSGGLRSGMTYGGARTIQELQRKAEFVQVTHSYQWESQVREKG